MRFLVYLFPVLINIVVGGVFFISSHRFSEAGYSEYFITATVALWSIVYSLVSLLLAKLSLEKYATKLLVFAGFFLAATSLCFVIFPSLSVQLLWVALIGIGIALYCAPFQVFMKRFSSADQDSGVVYSTAMYTAAWSLGFAIGPYLFGVLPQEAVFYLNIFFSLFLAFGVLLMNKFYSAAKDEVLSDAQGSETAISSNPYEKYPDYAWLGWLGAAIGVAGISVVRTLEPKLAVDLGIAKSDAAFILALVSFMQVIWALLLIKSKSWMYKSKTAILAGIVGLAGLLLFALGTSKVSLYLAAILYGSYSSYFYFTLVFFSLVHTTKSGKYLTVNEAVVGVSGIIGAIGGGIMADKTNLKLTFIACAILACLSIIHRVYVFQKRVSG